MEVPAFPMPAAAANRKLHDFLAKMKIQRKWWESKNQEPHGSHPFCPWFCMLVWRSSTRGSDFPFPSWIMAHDQWHLLSISRGKIRSCGMAFFRKWNLPIHLGNKPILYRLSISLPLLNSRLKSPRVWVQSLKEEHVLLKYVEIKTHMVLGHAWTCTNFGAMAFRLTALYMGLSKNGLSLFPYWDWHYGTYHPWESPQNNCTKSFPWFPCWWISSDFHQTSLQSGAPLNEIAKLGFT